MAQEPSSRLEPGTIVGPYRVVRHLGSGAFGAVYEAIKSPLQKRIALKLLHRNKATDASVVQRFMLEARAAASLKHPHIVDVDDIGVIDGVPFLAMEFLEGESLSDRMKRAQRLSVPDALELLLPICSAVAAVHERGIVHRDLKPDNIHLWSPLAGQFHPKLLDFGVAKMREADAGAAMTQTGAIMGTPMYMSVEQWGGSKYATGASDQWALAVILFECLTGRIPFEAEELHALMRRVSLEPPTPLRAFDPTLPTALEQVLLKALEKRPEDRYATVRAFACALLPFADAMTRARWAREFEGDPNAAAAPTPSSIPDSPTAPPPEKRSIAQGSAPDTLSKSAQEIAAPPPPPRGRAMALGLAALSLAGVLGGAAVVYRLQNPPSAPTTRAPTTAVPVIPAVDVPAVRTALAPDAAVTPPATPVAPTVVPVAAAPVAAPPIAAPPVATPPVPNSQVRARHGRPPSQAPQPMVLPAPVQAAPPPPPPPPPSHGVDTPIV